MSDDGHGMHMVAIEYRGELVALASPRRFHIVSPRLITRPAGDPELRFVAYMCACYAQVAAGDLPGPFTNTLAERWARAALIDSDALRANAGVSAVDLAQRWRVPVEQIHLARAELHGGGSVSPLRR